jgi:hypothetical protein
MTYMACRNPGVRWLVGARWLAGALLMLAVSTAAVVRVPLSGAATVPPGLSGTDWWAIQAQLPPAPAADLRADLPTQHAYIKASNTEEFDQFGYSVAVSGDTVVVGAMWEASSTTGVNTTPDEAAPKAGAAYVFVRSGTTWTQQAYLKAFNTGADDYFGFSVAIAGDTIAIGALHEDGDGTSPANNSMESAGAAYVFVRSAGTWSQQAYLKAANPGMDRFGSSVAVSGDTIVVGAPHEDSNTTGVNTTPNDTLGEAGAAYVFVRSAGIWSQQAYLKASNTGSGDMFGSSVAVSGDTVVVGAPFEDSSTTGVNTIPNEAATWAGAAYIFGWNGSSWSQQAYLKASNTGAEDWFGKSVAVDGTTVVVGAYGEDSSTTGVNTTPNDEASNAGAAYVFVRSGSTWAQQAYLKASNPGSGDLFGTSVAVSGGTIVIGAPPEDSNTAGVNSPPNEAAPNAGAAYVFVHSGTTWAQQAYVKASNTDAGDAFGHHVSVSDDTIVVGALGEGSSTTGVNTTPNELAPNAGATYIFGPVPMPMPTATPTTTTMPTTTATATSTSTPAASATATVLAPMHVRMYLPMIMSTPPCDLGLCP